MFREGDRTKLKNDTAVFKQLLGTGTFADVYEARRVSNNEPIAIKQLRKCNDSQLLRMKAIEKLQLSDRLMGAAGITEVLSPRGKRAWTGCVLPLVVGMSLDEYLKLEFNILDNILITLQIAKTLDDVHQLGIAHGDIHPRNFITNNFHGFPLTTIIDFDNAAIPDLPFPRSPGAKHFFSPESMEAYLNNVNYPPDIKTERCSGAKVFHWLFFGRDFYQTDSECEFEEATVKGKWNSDFAEGPIDLDVLGGVTNQWINDKFADLFKRAGGRDRDNRPAMSEWVTALQPLVDEGFLSCEACGGPMLMAPRTHCPYCNTPFPTLAAVAASGPRFVANGTPVLIGREAIASPGVSYRHAVITKMGPETFVTDLGSKNGTFRRGNDRWVRLPSHQQCLIQKGDRIRCGEVEFEIVGS